MEVTTTDGITVLGANVRELRKRRNLTQEELAKRAGLSVGTLSNLENAHRGRVHPKTKTALASALGVTVADLDGAQGEPISSSAAASADQLEVIRRVLALPPDDVRDLLEAISRRDQKRRPR